MKHKIKKLIMPMILIILGITIAIFVSLFNPKTTEQAKVFLHKYIEIKIKNIYPFPLLFKKGVLVKDILRKFNVGAREIYSAREKINFNTRLYEDTTLKIS